MNDENVSAALPEPPPPKPARREAAFDAAMRRFDGVADPAPPRASRWPRLDRPYAGALVAASLVALIALPVAWRAMEDAPIERERPVLHDGTTSPKMQFEPSSASDEIVAPPSVEAPPAALARTERGKDTEAAASAVPPPALADAVSPAAPLAQEPAARHGPVAQSPAADARETLRQERYAAESRAAEPRRRFAPSAPPPPAAQAPPANEDKAEGEIVVTSARIENRKAARRGDWNACTVDDPGRDLRACRDQVNPGAGGKRGRVDAQIADGLARAWDGDEDEAIKAFSRAIAAAPRSPTAFLNRGLAYRRAGDLDRALADLDQAIRLAPNSARLYYSRSLVHRDRGDRLRAHADALRAADLDPRYKNLTR